MNCTPYRDAGHPWSAAPGWDQMQLDAMDHDGLDALIEQAENKFWQVWIRDSHKPAAVMYKPSGSTASWQDGPRHGTPTSICRAIKVGDTVCTDYGGIHGYPVSQHRVIERTERLVSQTGIMLRVNPPVRGSAFLGDHGKVHNNAWLDSAWFRPVNI